MTDDIATLGFAGDGGSLVTFGFSGDSTTPAGTGLAAALAGGFITVVLSK